MRSGPTSRLVRPSSRRGRTWAFLYLATLAAAPGAAQAQGRPGPVVVKVEGSAGGYRLLRDGKPFFVKGVGGDGPLELLASLGGNSVRTWGADRAGSILDEAQRLGLAVTVGIWLGHERHGFNYNDADQVANQLESARKTILRYKDHPALLMWGLGNEMEGYAKGDNAAIWSAVNNLAAVAKRLDPNHPTMTVIAEIGGDKVKNVHRLCPEIDIVGINSYGGVASLPKRYREAGGVKPYIITEFGPPGIWEISKTEWGAAPEPTSTAKAEFYRHAYEQAIAGAKGVCLGSYAFTWGHKQEATATWFGLFLPDGTRTAAVDTLGTLWSGKPPANRCPVVQELKVEGPNQVEPGATVRVALDASDPEGDPIRVRWALVREAASYGEGGDAEEVPPEFPDAILKAGRSGAEVRMPKDGGGYRLFAFVYDNHQGAAMANVPLLVKGPASIPAAKAATLPFVLYDEATATAPYVPSGWMGETKAIKLSQDSEDRPHAGKTCLRVDFSAAQGWGGVVWQSPAGDWGNRPGGFNLSGAKTLSLWARGDKGGEVVSFQFGLLGPDKKFHDTAKGSLEKITLSPEWKQYTIDLTGKDLSRIKTGFAWVVGGQGKPIAFFLDDIRYE